MKYLYYYLWILNANFNKIVLKLLVIPSNKIIIRVFNKTEREQNSWRNELNKTLFDFPEGITNRLSFGLLLFLISIPIIIISVKFRIPLFDSELIFGILFIGMAVFVNFWIFTKKHDWLKEKIDLIKETFYLKMDDLD